MRIIQHRLSSLDEAYSLVEIGKVDLVINATALGSRSLLGVEDQLVHPAKGQTVLVRAPDVTKYYGVKTPHKTMGQKRYIIPRPGAEGQVILGGCYLANDWSTDPNPVVAQQILKDAHELAPHLDGKQGKGSWRDIEIIKHNVGSRPVRTGGMRLELEYRKIGDRPSRSQGDNDDDGAAAALLPASVKDVGRQVAVVHAYGIGAAGYQGSLGVAQEVADLVEQWSKASKSS